MRYAALRRSALLPIVAVAGIVVFCAGGAAAATVQPHATTFNVKDYGAKADGKSNAAPAIDKAISAANAAGGGTVEFPAGGYLSAGTVHLKSNVTIQLDAGSTITGSADGYDKPESNPNDKYQDYGHSHFHNAMFYGDGVDHVSFTGSGTIDGGGHLITGNPKSGQADKIISLTRCTNLTLSGITLKRGGHFAALINGCDHVVSDHLTISTAGDRDGWNIISTTNVTITNINDAANDDALVFKSDWALGKTLPNGHVTVTNANLSAGCCNALMFGSETCGDFTDYQFSHIKITGAGKSGLGLVSMDGAHISNVHYDDITMSNTQSPIMQKIGTRKRCGGSPGVGSISDIHYSNITGTKAGKFSPTLWGESGHQISNITFDNVHLDLPGGSGAVSSGVPSNSSTDYNPNSIGTRPAYGFYLHNVSGITFHDSGFTVDKADSRPAIIANAASGLTLDNVTAEASKASYDLGLQQVSGYCLTGGTKLRINNSGSTEKCAG
ncbi:MAG TPA: glycosyl hydrolase family 28 protein [Kutzneria sp.]|nr:glycosyl hydrolase family 28 protein [Kutzneria sp.]